MVKMDKQIVLAGMDNSLQSFYLKGKKNFHINMQHEILVIKRMDARTATANS